MPTDTNSPNVQLFRSSFFLPAFGGQHEHEAERKNAPVAMPNWKSLHLVKGRMLGGGKEANEIYSRFTERSVDLLKQTDTIMQITDFKESTKQFCN